jgi:hypothetical protein
MFLLLPGLLPMRAFVRQLRSPRLSAREVGGGTVGRKRAANRRTEHHFCSDIVAHFQQGPNFAG